MKELCLRLFISWTYLFGGTFGFFYRAMENGSKPFGSASVNNKTSTVFEDFDQIMKKEIEKEKIKRKLCEHIIEICKQPPKPNITIVKPPETSKNESAEQPHNINISLVFSEPSEHSNDTNCMKFRLPEESATGKIITGADVFVYITNKNKRSTDKNSRRKRRRDKMRKISIRVSLLNEETHQKKFISRLRFRPNPDKKWYKLVLPFSVVQQASQLENRALNLCIECKRCNRNTQVILPLKTSKKMRKFIRTRIENENQSPQLKNKKGKGLRLRKKRPFLMCHTTKKSFQRKRRELQCDKANPYSHCCRYQEYIRFSDIGLGDRVTYPDGYYKTQCIGSCSHNSSHIDSSLSQCRPSRYKPFQTLFVFDSDVMYLDIPQGNIQECRCQ